MARKFLHNLELLDPEAAASRRACILIDGGRLIDILDPGTSVPEGAESVDLNGRSLAPGFIDLHFHGCLIFASGEALPAAFRATAEALVRTGTTGYLATTVAWNDARMRDFLAQCQAEMTQDRPDASCLIGAHLEGPWINPAAAGAQPSLEIRPFSPNMDLQLLNEGKNCLKMVTFAPEVEGADRLLEGLRERNIVPALGHSCAGAAEIDAAVGRGMTHATHLYNAMGPIHHREPGVAGQVLGDDRISCDLICDGIHVDPAMVRVAARVKAEKLMLITDRIIPQSVASDALSSFGSGPIHDDGEAIRMRDGSLAGSSLNLDRALRNIQQFGAMSRLEAVAAVTLRPARLLGIESERGTLRAGARADFAILDRNDCVSETWIAGRRVWSATS